MHPGVQKAIERFKEATEKQEIKERDPFTVTDEELDEILESGDIPWYLKYEAF